MRPSDYVEANRRMWNEAAEIHAKSFVVDLMQRVEADDFSTFDHVEEKLFAIIGLKDRAVIQLGCNNGRELISVKKAGAGRCVGLDMSDESISQARQLACKGRVNIDFVRSSVYEVSRDF